jgi:peptidoglycan/LPS O-acetylase OafA/YrhL
MATLGDKISNSRSNNLNVVRLFLALLVIFSHSFQLSIGKADEFKCEPLYQWTHQQQTFGDVAVSIFFLISGLLITASWLRSKSMQDYIMKRVLRIYPGFILSLGFSATLIWLFCPEFRAHVGHGVAWAILLLNDCFFLTYNSLEWTGIFQNNPYPGIANGSLWTIQKEFGCYLLVAVIGMLCLFKRRILVLCGSLVVYLIYCSHLFKGEDTFAFDSRFLTFFFCGMNAWLWRDKIPLSKWAALGCIPVLLICTQFNPWFSVIFPILGSYLVLCFGYGTPLRSFDWTNRMDISYGTYLFAFPIQQMVAMHESLQNHWANFLIATPITIGMACLSWIFVERRFLALKNNSHLDFDPGEKIQNEIKALPNVSKP